MATRKDEPTQLSIVPPNDKKVAEGSPRRKGEHSATSVSTKRTLPPSRDFKFKGYVRCELARSEKEDFLQWRDLNDDSLFGLMCEMVGKGYNISIKASGARDGYNAVMSDVEATNEYAGYVLSAFGKTVEGSVAALLYKHNVKLDADWGNAVDEGEEYR
jgi:hypothetical protein